MVLIHVLVLSIIVKNTYSLRFEDEAKLKFENVCMDMVTDPCFEDDKLFGTFWTVYYVWNEKMYNVCIDLWFEKATDSMKRRFQRTMERSIKAEVRWAKATLREKSNWTDGNGAQSSESLLLPVKTPKGNNVGLFQTIPKIKKDQNLVWYLEELPTFALAMKLFNNGRHLIIADCLGGVISFLVRRDQKHTWNEIDTAIKSFNFGDVPGFPVCKYNLRNNRPKQ